MSRQRSTVRVERAVRAVLWLGCLGAVSGVHGQTGEPESDDRGFRKITGRHLTLVTDLPPSPSVDQLPRFFDQAVAPWCEYFNVPVDRVLDWRVRAYLMGNRERFREAGWLPASLPPFRHGYQRGDRMWVVEQPSDYYRRHLLLHEGTHAFMRRWLGAAGPPWYMEGIAELLATHQIDDGALKLHVIPARKGDVPDWGRIKIIQKAVAADNVRSLADVLDFQARQFGDVDAYAWSWTAATFLDGHPKWRSAFAAMQPRVRWDGPRFNAQFWNDVHADRIRLDEAWQVFVHQLDYGYNVAQDEIIYRPLRAWESRAECDVDSRLGWQSTGLQLRSDRKYHISARGRYRLVDDEPAWFSEAGGVTIRYHQGWPLGILLAAIRPDPTPGITTPLVNPRPIGLDAGIQPVETGVLFLRVNEPAGRLGDNAGHLSVVVETWPVESVDVRTQSD